MAGNRALEQAAAYFDGGEFVADLTRWVAIPTESQADVRVDVMRAYFENELMPLLKRAGFTCRVWDNPNPRAGGFLFAERFEDESLPTVLTYGHGDVVMGMEGRWREGLSPWTLIREGERLYGRGAADNKGQHLINIAALEAVVRARGRLGFNCKVLIETGEEAGSPGLRDVCIRERDALAADVFIGSDGPRITADRPTIFLGNRGSFNFDMTVDLREGSHHSGNWGGALANPAVILVHALATMTSPRGQILVDGWLPRDLPQRVRELVRDLTIGEGDDSPQIDPEWGEPGLSPAEKVYGWNTFEILAFGAGNPERPVNAIPGKAAAHCSLRFVVGSDPENFLPALRRHLDERGFGAVKLQRAKKGYFDATRLDADNPWVTWISQTLARASNKDVAILPNLGGSLPNAVFAHDLGLPTIWIPHSYPACSQHAVNEHLLVPVAREALMMMTSLFWDLGDPTRATPPLSRG